MMTESSHSMNTAQTLGIVHEPFGRERSTDAEFGSDVRNVSIPTTQGNELTLENYLNHIETKIEQLIHTLPKQISRVSQKKIDETIYAPLLMAGGISTLVLGILLMTKILFLSIPFIGLSLFSLFAFKKIKDRYGLRIRDII